MFRRSKRAGSKEKRDDVAEPDRESSSLDESDWVRRVPVFTIDVQSRLRRYGSAGAQIEAGAPTGAGAYPDALEALRAVPELFEHTVGDGPTDRTQHVADVLRRQAETLRLYVDEWDRYLAENDLPAKLEAIKLSEEFTALSDTASDLLAEIAADARRLVAERASTQSSSTTLRTSIPERVRHEVWRRDEGRCVDCGSRERLEFDHIIPFSKGGSSTTRNIELRCERCNRTKGASI